MKSVYLMCSARSLSIRCSLLFRKGKDSDRTSAFVRKKPNVRRKWQAIERAALQPGAEVLIGPVGLRLQLGSGAHRPVGVPQELSGHNDQVRLPCTKDVVRLLG